MFSSNCYKHGWLWYKTTKNNFSPAHREIYPAQSQNITNGSNLHCLLIFRETVLKYVNHWQILTLGVVTCAVVTLLTWHHTLCGPARDMIHTGWGVRQGAAQCDQPAELSVTSQLSDAWGQATTIIIIRIIIITCLLFIISLNNFLPRSR